MAELVLVLFTAHLHLHARLQGKVVLRLDVVVHQHHAVGQQGFYARAADAVHLLHKELHQFRRFIDRIDCIFGCGTRDRASAVVARVVSCHFVMRVREHVDRLYGSHLVLAVEQLEVACLCGRVAAHVDDAFRLGSQNHVDYVIVHTSAGRVGDDDIRTSVLRNEVVGKDVLHVARIEQRVVDTVQGRVHLGILDGFGHIFDAHHLACLACHEVGDGTRTRVEVVHQLVARKSGKLACHLI